MTDETPAQERGRKKAERGEPNNPEKQVWTVDGSEESDAHDAETERQKEARS